jgi:hypothetical protein
MAYSALRKDGKIKDFIQARKDKKEVTQATSNMTLEEMKYKANIGMYDRPYGGKTIYRGKGSNLEVFKTGTVLTGDATTGWMKTGEKINPKVGERRSAKIRRMKSRSIKGSETKDKIKDISSKVGKGIKFGAVELGHIALDKLPMSGVIPGVGKRRNFVGLNLANGSQDRVIDSDEEGHHKRFSFGGVDTEHFERMSNKKWREKKRERFTVGQRLANTGLKVGIKSLTGLISTGMAMGFSGKQVDENTLNPVKDLVKKGVKKIKRIIN